MTQKITVEEKSDKYQLNKADMMKIVKGAGIALGGFILTYATDLIPQIDWGSNAPLVVAISGIVINLGWKLLKGK